MKKFLSFLATAALCSAVFTASAYAANVVVDIDKTEVKVDEVITVEVTVPDISAATFSAGIQFDTADFECVDLYGPEGKDADPIDKEWFYLIDKDARRNPETDADPAPSIDMANSKGVISALWSSSANVNYAGGIVFTAELKAKRVTDAANITYFEETDVDGTTEGDVSVSDVLAAAIVVKGDEPVTPPAPEYDFGTAGNNFEGKASKYWTVNYEAGEFTGTDVISLSDGETTKSINVTTAEGFDIGGAVSFYVYVIGNDIADVYIVE